MTNEDYPSKVYELLKDLEGALSCVDYNCSYREILEKYSCSSLKKFIDVVYIKLQQKYCGLSEKIKVVKDIIVCAKE